MVSSNNTNRGHQHLPLQQLGLGLISPRPQVVGLATHSRLFLFFLESPVHLPSQCSNCFASLCLPAVYHILAQCSGSQCRRATWLVILWVTSSVHTAWCGSQPASRCLEPRCNMAAGGSVAVFLLLRHFCIPTASLCSVASFPACAYATRHGGGAGLSSEDFKVVFKF